MSEKNKKAIICILAGRDSEEKNEELGRLIATILYQADRNKAEFKSLLANYFFVLTEGTFNRIFVNRDYPSPNRGYFWDYWFEFFPKSQALNNATLKRFFEENCVCVGGYKEGSIIIFSNLVVSQYCSIIWPFLDPHQAHCTRPENLALLRLCDVWKTKWLPNFKSVLEWILDESEYDAKRSYKIKIDLNPRFTIFLPSHDGREPYFLKGKTKTIKIDNRKFKFKDFSKGEDPRIVKESGKDVKSEFNKSNKIVKQTLEERFPRPSQSPSNRNLALIAHDAMKTRMVEFVVEYKKEIDKYVKAAGRIFTTQATGKEIEKNVLDKTFSNKIVPCLSGPLGGDIQIATAILLDRCDTVIFFIDPLNPHPHIDDIRVVLMAGMTNPNVRVLTNQTAAQAWAEALRKRF